jgi:hypothetical protein
MDEDGEFPEDFYAGIDSYYYVSIRWNEPEAQSPVVADSADTEVTA